MRFVKMHGTGNDYVFVDCFEQDIADPCALSRMVSNRHTGVGSDGLILLKPSQTADARMKIYNADGSPAQMCGNGIRCVAKILVETGRVCGPTLRVETDAGLRTLECQLCDGRVVSIRVDMGVPSLDASALPARIDVERMTEYPIRFGNTQFAITGVSMGNPHAVVFVDDLDAIDLRAVGPTIERAREFPERINVHFARALEPQHLEMKSWERGSGETRACGTGACAVCVAGVVTERTRRAVTVTLPGGDLDIEWAANGHVYMTGPAVEVFSGEWPT